MTELLSNRAPRKPWSDRLFSLAFVLSLAVAIFAAWYDTLPVEGQLILNEMACTVVGYHGGKVEAVAGTGYCVLRTKFRPPEHGGSAQVQVETGYGVFKLEVAEQQIVSLAAR